MPEDYYGDVIAVYPNKIRIVIDKEKYDAIGDEQLKKFTLGSYLEISDKEDAKILSIVENFSITYEIDKDGEEKKKYIIEALPLGSMIENKFSRGGGSIVLPPKGMRPASESDIRSIYEGWIEEKLKFSFSSLIQNNNINVSVDGNKFFNKHFAIVGATGSGKSHSVAKILQNAISAKESGYKGLNNSHIILFDIHSEYKSAFSNANYINVEKLKLPYWLLNADELEELFLDVGDRNNYNQVSVLRKVITENKKSNNPGIERVNFDMPLKFKINEVVNCLKNLQNETVDYNNNLKPKIEGENIEFPSDTERIKKYFKKYFKFEERVRSRIKGGIYADGTLDKFIDRFENKIKHKRLNFLFSEENYDLKFETVIQRLLGYDSKKDNISIIDLSGVPFEVLSITVSLISRILFEYGYHYKKLLEKESKDCETPLLLVYEEAHKYAPKSELSKFRPSRLAIERIAKEGRKYGITLGIISQRPSEISETIFSQCNNFIAMRLTNPDDQNYVRRLLPDSIGNLTDVLPSLKAGEALIIGDSVVMPTLIYFDKCTERPSSNDIKYYDIWKTKWKDVKFDVIINKWKEH